VQYSIDRDDMLRRFLSYVQIWTTSDEDSEDTPSTERQWDLAKILVDELKELGLEDARVDEHCYVYASLPERFPPGAARAGKAPAVGLIAHMDVSSAVSGENVKPIVHERYHGGPIELPGDSGIVLTPEVDAPLGDCAGLDIVTSDGTTLLGADDKAGIAIILSVLKALKENPDFSHGPIQVAFTPDEEIGRGADKFDLDAFGAEVAYTVDGEGLGEVEDETFCADSMDITFHGINVHPGFAKDKMINSIKLAAELIESLPKDRISPETTENREGYVHPRLVEGTEEKTVVKFLVRDFTMEGLRDFESLLEGKANAVVARYPGARVELEIKHWYGNMKAVLNQRPDALEFAAEAIRSAGLEVVNKPIRGGTDGARLSFSGLPTPNLFTGGHNFHGKREWVAVQHMEKSAEVCLRLLDIWAGRGEKKGRLPPVEEP
jgi:tripeptide aminopeptidase